MQDGSIKTLDAYEAFVANHQIAVVHVSRDNCSVCHAVLPRIQELVARYEGVALGNVSADDVPEIAGALSILLSLSISYSLKVKKCIVKVALLI